MKIQDRAMLCTLTLSMWNGQRIDPKTTQEVLAGKHADSDAGRFSKLLVTRKALEPILQAHNAARRDFYRFTLPWDNNGTGALATAMFMDFSTAMQRNRAACEKTYDHFCATVYPAELLNAPARMKTLFDATDFPDQKRIRDKFGFKLFTYPIPDSAGFKGLLPDAEEEKTIMQDYETEVTDRIAAAQQRIWFDLFETLKHFVETMKTSDKVFRNSTVSNLLEIVQQAPKLSLKPDTKLDTVCTDITTLLKNVSVDNLRQNKLVRANTALTAQAALAKIEKQLKGAI